MRNLAVQAPEFRMGPARGGGSHPPWRSRRPRRGGRWTPSRPGPLGWDRRGGSGAVWRPAPWPAPWPAPRAAPSPASAASEFPRGAREATALLAPVPRREPASSIGVGLSGSPGSGEKHPGPFGGGVGATPGPASPVPSPSSREAARATHHLISSMSQVMTAARLASSAGIGGKSAGSWVMAPVRCLFVCLPNTIRARCKGYFPRAILRVSSAILAGTDPAAHRRRAGLAGPTAPPRQTAHHGEPLG